MVTSLIRVETHLTMTLHPLYFFFHYPHPLAHQRTNYTALEGKNTYMAYWLTGLRGLQGLQGLRAYRAYGLTGLTGLLGLLGFQGLQGPQG